MNLTKSIIRRYFYSITNLGLSFLIVVFFAVEAARASDFLALKRQADIIKTRWTLKDWLEQKERSKLMDQWLSWHRPSPYEFSLAIHHRFVNSYQVALSDADWGPSRTELGASFSAYSHMVGLSAQQVSFAKKLTQEGFLELRILGDSLQSTHLALAIGQESQQFKVGNGLFIRSNYVKARLQIYLLESLGLVGGYALTPQAASIDGVSDKQLVLAKTQLGLFVEFGLLRVFGRYLETRSALSTIDGGGAVSDEEKSSLADAIPKKESAIESGIEIFF